MKKAILSLTILLGVFVFTSCGQKPTNPQSSSGNSGNPESSSDDRENPLKEKEVRISTKIEYSNHGYSGHYPYEISFFMPNLIKQIDTLGDSCLNIIKHHIFSGGPGLVTIDDFFRLNDKSGTKKSGPYLYSLGSSSYPNNETALLIKKIENNNTTRNMILGVYELPNKLGRLELTENYANFSISCSNQKNLPFINGFEELHQ